jgi:hypothetical protein
MMETIMLKVIVRSMLTIAISIACVAVFLTDSRAQDGSLKRQLVGVWSLASVETLSKDGKPLPYLEGGNIKGLLIITDTRYSLQIIAEYPKLASNDRLKTTPDEDKAVAHGVLSNWGAYTVNEAERALTLANERSSFPNQNGAIGLRTISLLTPSELKFSVPTTRTGNTQNLSWRRVE